MKWIKNIGLTYNRLKRYICNKIWVREKRKEIDENMFWIDTNLMVFAERTKIFDSRDGTHDLSVLRTYKLKPTSDDGSKYIVGTSIENFIKLSRSLEKALLILNRFQKTIQRRGWLYDRKPIIEKNRRLLREKHETISHEFNGVSVLSSNIPIPN